MKLVPERDVIKEKDKDKRNTKRRYLVTDGICFRCCTIVNYSYEKRCTICCGSDEFLVGEPSRVLRELLELNIEQLRAICEIRGRSIGSGSRANMVLELLKLIFPRLCNVDKRIDEIFVKKIIYRNIRRFWYLADIENAIIKVRKNRKINIKLVDEKDMDFYV